MGSIAGVRPGKQGSVYCAAKAGLRGFTGALRPEVSSSGVRVSLVMPGMVDTDFYSEQNFGPGTSPGEALHPADIATPVTTILESPSHVVFDEMLISRLKHVVRKR